MIFWFQLIIAFKKYRHFLAFEILAVYSSVFHNAAFLQHEISSQNPFGSSQISTARHKKLATLRHSWIPSCQVSQMECSHTSYLSMVLLQSNALSVLQVFLPLVRYLHVGQYFRDAGNVEPRSLSFLINNNIKKKDHSYAEFKNPFSNVFECLFFVW